MQVVIPKAVNEKLGVVIVESGWGSMLPTIVLANLCPTGPAARCGHLNIGDQVRQQRGWGGWGGAILVQTSSFAFLAFLDSFESLFLKCFRVKF